MVTSSDILNGKVLVVDDQEANVLLLERMLRGAGYASVASTMDPTARAVRLLTQHRFPFRLRLLVHLLRCQPQTVSVLLRSRAVLPYRAVRKHLGSVGE